MPPDQPAGCRRSSFVCKPVLRRPWQAERKKSCGQQGPRDDCGTAVAENRRQMTDRTPCVQCKRTIDAYAKTCPFCSWDQSETPPAHVEGAPAAPVWVPPKENLWRNRIFGGVAFVALLIIAFVVGALVHTSDPTEAKSTITTATNAPAPAQAAAAAQQKPSVELVPDGGGGSLPRDETPITSAPITATDGSTSNPYARADATALPQSDYAQLAQRARAEQRSPAGPRLVDPRNVGGAPYGTSQPRSARGEPNVPMASAMTSSRRVTRTEPVAVYQPIPPIRVGREAVARLLLTVGADGRVQDIEITKPIPGDTTQLIGAVQEWRFRPATENGVPVASRFSVDITFHGND